ncbi:hypothetical protein DXG01_017042 [Tephrocybe rancida]|nr:hypothetical protein DXG01_017042 [Tephrocybe rancida]
MSTVYGYAQEDRPTSRPTSPSAPSTGPAEILTSTHKTLVQVIDYIQESEATRAESSSPSSEGSLSFRCSSVDKDSSASPSDDASDTRVAVSSTTLLREVRDALVFVWCTMYQHATGIPYEDALTNMERHSQHK